MMKKLFLLLLLFLGLNACGSSDCGDVHCDDFKTQEQAQRAYKNDKKCLKHLDKDRDGKACESLPKE